MRLASLFLSIAALPAFGAELPRNFVWYGNSTLVSVRLSGANATPSVGWLVETPAESAEGELTFANPVPPNREFRYSGPYTFETAPGPMSKRLAQIRLRSKQLFFCVRNPHEPAIGQPIKWDYCAKLKQRPNNSSKPTPLRGAA